MALTIKTLDLPRGPIIHPGQPRDYTGNNSLGIYTQESTQRYILGTRFLTWNGKVYKYMLANGTLVPDVGCEKNLPQTVAYVAVTRAQAIGDDVVQLTVGATDGDAGDGVVAENSLAGGELIIFKAAASNAISRTIKANNAVASGGGTLTMLIDEKLHVALTTSDNGEADHSPYHKVTLGASTTKSIVALPVLRATTGNFCWGQTWGPCWIAPQADVGAAASAVQCVFRHDGSIEVHSAANATTLQKQHAGFVLSWAQAGGQGAPFFMLQISV